MYRLLFVILLCFVVSAALGQNDSGGPSQIFAEEDFSDEPDYLPLGDDGDGTRSIVNGEYVLDYLTEFDERVYVFPNPRVTVDEEYEAVVDVRVINNVAGKRANIVFFFNWTRGFIRSADEAFVISADGTWYARQRDGLNHTRLVSGIMPPGIDIFDGETHRLALWITGTTRSLLVDGQLVGSYKGLGISGRATPGMSVTGELGRLVVAFDNYAVQTPYEVLEASEEVAVFEAELAAAQTATQTAIESAMSPAELLVSKGQRAQNSGDIIGALEFYMQAVEEDPNYGKAYTAASDTLVSVMYNYSDLSAASNSDLWEYYVPDVQVPAPDAGYDYEMILVGCDTLSIQTLFFSQFFLRSVLDFSSNAPIFQPELTFSQALSFHRTPEEAQATYAAIVKAFMQCSGSEPLENAAQLARQTTTIRLHIPTGLMNLTMGGAVVIWQEGVFVSTSVHTTEDTVFGDSQVANPATNMAIVNYNKLGQAVLESAQRAPTNTPGPSPTPTSTFTPSATFTATDTPTATFTPTITLTASDTLTPSTTPTASDTPTPTNTFTPSATFTATNTSTATFTPSATPTSTFTPTATFTPTLVTCAGAPPSRLYPGDRGRVNPGPRNRVRSAATTNSGTLGYIEPLEDFEVLDGPVCADGYAWYRVQRGRLDGWTAEGVPGEYWLEPILETDVQSEDENVCVVVADDLTNMRGGPGTSFAIVGQLSAGQVVEVVGRQESTQGFVWWKLINGGWVRSDVIGTQGDCTNIPDPSQAQTSQSGSSNELHAGGTAQVFVEDEGLSLRSGAGINFSLLEKLPSGTVVEILEGPVGADGYVWWRVRAPSGREGWAVESADRIRTLIPLS